MARITGSMDTNVLLRLLLEDVPKQHVAVVNLLNGTQGQLAVSDTAIIELAYTLTNFYGFTRQHVAEAVQGLMDIEKINCNRALFDRVVPHYVSHPKLSFEDCCLAEYAVLNDAEPLWTFDKKLASQHDGARLLQS